MGRLFIDSLLTSGGQWTTLKRRGTENIDTLTRNGWARLTTRASCDAIIFSVGKSKGANEGDKATRQRHTEKEKGAGRAKKKQGGSQVSRGCSRQSPTNETMATDSLRRLFLLSFTFQARLESSVAVVLR